MKVRLEIIQKSCAGVYRYGFNGLEGDGEINGPGRSYTTEFRQYDPIVGRWWAVDPLAGHPSQIGMSPYSAFWNNPIGYNDPDGRCPNCPPGSQFVADDQVLSYFYLNFVASRKNLASTLAGFFRSGSHSPLIVRTQYSVVADADGQVSLHQSQPYLQDKTSAAFFGLIDGVSLYPGTGPAGFMAKTGSGPIIGNASRQAVRQFTREGELGGVINLFEGNSKKGLQHILERHSADDFLDAVKGDLFPKGTNREQIFDAIGEVYNKGARTSSPSNSVQTFERRIKLNDQTDNYRLVIDKESEEVVTFFRMGGNE